MRDKQFFKLKENRFTGTIPSELASAANLQVSHILDLYGSHQPLHVHRLPVLANMLQLCHDSYWIYGQTNLPGRFHLSWGD